MLVVFRPRTPKCAACVQALCKQCRNKMNSTTCGLHGLVDVCSFCRWASKTMTYPSEIIQTSAHLGITPDIVKRGFMCNLLTGMMRSAWRASPTCHFPGIHLVQSWLSQRCCDVGRGDVCCFGLRCIRWTSFTSSRLLQVVQWVPSPAMTMVRNSRASQLCCCLCCHHSPLHCCISQPAGVVI